MTSRIFFGTNPATRTVNDFIDFDSSTIADRGHIMSSTYKIDRVDTTLDNPDKNSIGTYQDTGPTNVEITLTGIITGPEDTVNRARKNIRTFGLRDATSQALPFGLVGIISDEYSEFNLTPSATRGGVIKHIELIRPTDQPEKIGFIAIIQVYGNRGSSPDFGWL